MKSFFALLLLFAAILFLPWAMSRKPAADDYDPYADDAEYYGDYPFDQRRTPNRDTSHGGDAPTNVAPQTTPAENDDAAATETGEPAEPASDSIASSGGEQETGETSEHANEMNTTDEASEQSNEELNEESSETSSEGETLSASTELNAGDSAAETPISDPAVLQPIVYPESRRGRAIDRYHGVAVADPYRWLESSDSRATRNWVAAQNKITREFLDRLPERAVFERRLTELFNYERISLPSRYGKYYFHTRHDGKQNQPILYVSERIDDSEPRVLIDPNKLSDDGTIALSDWVPSPDGRLMAYAVSNGGSDWRTWRVLDVESGKDRNDVLEWLKFSSVSWLPDGSGFYYSRYERPAEGEKLTAENRFPKLCFHRMGTPQADDKIVYHRPDEPKWGINGHVTEDGRYLIISISQGSVARNQLFYQEIKLSDAGQPKTNAPIVELLKGFDYLYAYVGHDAETIYLYTDDDAPRRRLVALDLKNPQKSAWRELIPEGEHVLRGVSLAGDTFFAQYLRHAHSAITMHNLTGEPLGEVALPGLGSAGGFGGLRDDEETFFSFGGFNTPGKRYRLRLSDRQMEELPEIRAPFNADDYVTRQEFIASKDGTRVPIFICHRKDLPLDRPHPTILYAYGGFNIPLTPGFSPVTLAWMEQGGVYVQANLRGGGEYGRAWYEAGTRERKQNVFDDFIAVAEWLIEEKITTSKQLAIRGGSNGGLLVGAAMTQRPELFGAAIPAVGVLDMLRYHKFTIGWAWEPDYGTSDDRAMFDVLRKYSPLHNIRQGTRYPATLITTGDHDDRVVPAHSYKFAAELQRAQAKDGPPVLIRIETRAGHGAGTPQSMVIAQAADVLGFIAHETGLTTK